MIQEIDIIGYITQETLILVPVLFIIGLMLKRTPKLYDWIIPYVLGIIGIILAYFLTFDYINAVIQGILAAGAAVYVHQLYKQPIKKDDPKYF